MTDVIERSLRTSAGSLTGCVSMPSIEAFQLKQNGPFIVGLLHWAALTPSW
jgi:hypothetical protein